jgi:hypothetical protein
LFVAILPSLASGLLAQNVTVPATLQGVEGSGSSGVPFTGNLACVYQCLYDAAELPWSGPRAISGIALRADNGTPLAAGSAIAAKGYLDISVRMSTTYRTAATASAVFAENRGEDSTLVLSMARIQLPAQPAQGIGPRPANIDLLFAVPWFYGLTPARPSQPPPDSLLVEILIHSQPTGSYRLDNLGGCTAPAADFGNQGPLCTVPGAAGQPTLGTDTAMLAGQPFTWTIGNAPANAPYVLFGALTSQGVLYGNPAFGLPYPMFDPANPAQPSAAFAALRYSAPDCWFNLDPATTIFGLCDAAGQGTLTVAMPSGRANVGLTLFGQALLLAPTANALQMVTTKGRQSTICGPLGVARIHAFHSSTTPPTSGTVALGQAAIFEVR